MNITFDDTSPVFHWYDGPSKWHRLYGQQGYYANTFHHTNTEGTYMELTWNGSAISLFGRKQNNQAGYSTFTLDNGPEINCTDPGSADSDGIFLSQSGLNPTEQHILRWFGHPAQGVPGNSNTTAFLIDHAVVTLPATGTIYSTIIDDQSPMWQYDEGWTSDTSAGLGQVYNGSQHYTRSSNSVKLNFHGSSIGIYGTVGTSTGNYSVSVDGIDQGIFNSSYTTILRKAALFVASGLEDTAHDVEITNIPISINQTGFGLDYAVVNSSSLPSKLPSGTTLVQSDAGVDPNTGSQPVTSSSASGVLDPTPQVDSQPTSGVLDPTTQGNNQPTLTQGAPYSPTVLSAPSSGHTSAPTGVIVGAVLGSILGVLLLAIVLIGISCYRRRRNRNSMITSSSFIDLSPGEPKSDTRATPYPRPFPESDEPGISQPAFYYTPTHDPFSVTQQAYPQAPPPPVPHPPSSYPYSIYPPSSADGDNAQHPPATPSSKQGAGSRTPSVPSTIASPLTPSTTSLPYRNRHSRPDNPAPSSNVSSMGSIRKSYQLWTRTIGSHPFPGIGSGSITPAISPVPETPADEPMAVPYSRSPVPDSSIGGSSIARPRRSAGVSVPLSARSSNAEIVFPSRMRKAGREMDGGPVSHGPVKPRELQPPDYEQATEP